MWNRAQKENLLLILFSLIFNSNRVPHYDKYIIDIFLICTPNSPSTQMPCLWFNRCSFDEAGAMPWGQPQWFSPCMDSLTSCITINDITWDFCPPKLAWKWSGRWDINGNVGEEGAGGNNRRAYRQNQHYVDSERARGRERDINKALLCLIKLIPLLEQKKTTPRPLVSMMGLRGLIKAQFNSVNVCIVTSV